MRTLMVVLFSVGLIACSDDASLVGPMDMAADLTVTPDLYSICTALKSDGGMIVCAPGATDGCGPDNSCGICVAYPSGGSTGFCTIPD